MKPANKKGPRNEKSWPLLTAQNVYRVRLTTTTTVKIAANSTTFPAKIKRQRVIRQIRVFIN